MKKPVELEACIEAMNNRKQMSPKELAEHLMAMDRPVKKQPSADELSSLLFSLVNEMNADLVHEHMKDDAVCYVNGKLNEYGIDIELGEHYIR